LDAARKAYTATLPAVLEMPTAIVKTFYHHRELLDENQAKNFLQDMHKLAFDNYPNVYKQLSVSTGLPSLLIPILFILLYEDAK
jgi:hypothetical protein